MIRVAIIDDEAEARVLLRSYLERYQTEKSIQMDITEYESGASFLVQQESYYDLILLDIQMPIIDGMETARQLRKTNQGSTLIFVTNSVQHAVEGYSVDASDYLVKPLSYQAFSIKFRHALDRVNRNRHFNFSVKTSDGVFMLDVTDILYVEVMKHDLIYHTNTAEYHTRGTMNVAEQQLSEYNFVRCNVCYLVNLSHITSIEGDDVVLGTVKLRMSAAKRKGFLLAMMRSMKGSR